jgi:hypothetical protein
MMALQSRNRLGMRGKTTPERMLELLRDGQPHTTSELHDLCGPSNSSVVPVHIHTVRKHLLRDVEAVLCVIKNRSVHYQLVYRYDRVDLNV